MVEENVRKSGGKFLKYDSGGTWSRARATGKAGKVARAVVSIARGHGGQRCVDLRQRGFEVRREGLKMTGQGCGDVACEDELER